MAEPWLDAVSISARCHSAGPGGTTEGERPAFVPLLRGLGSEGEAGLGKECLDEGGLVLDALEPVLDDDGELAHVAGGEIARAVLHGRPDRFSRFVIVHGSLDRRLLAHRLSAGRGCSGWWSGPGCCGHAAREVDRRGRRGRGHLLQMTAAASVPDGELWASFPEAIRNDILGLLGMLLERWAVSAGLA